MKVLFTYNAKLECDELGNVYGNEINNDVIDRYKYLGNEITFLVRKRYVQSLNAQSLTKLNMNSFKVVFVPEFNSIQNFITNFKEITRIIKEEVEKTDIVVSRVPSTLSRFAIQYSRLFKKPYLLEVVGCPLDALWNYSLLGKLLAPYAYLKMKLMVAKAPFVIYVTNKFLQNRYPNKHEASAISDVILPPPAKSVLQNKISKLQSWTSKEPFILGTSGGLDVPYKGQSLVLKAIAELKKNGVNILYLLAGKGSGIKINREIEQLDISDSVEVVGQIPFERMAEFYDRLHVYIQPSLQEGLPRSLIEAMNRACPCIGTNTGGIPELLEDGYIIADRNYKSLANLILQTDASQWIAQSNRNFERALEYQSEFLKEKRIDFYYKFKQFYSLS